MGDDWRVEVDLRDPGRAARVVDRVEARELAGELAGSMHDRVAVSRDEERVYFYGGSREQAEQALEVAQGIVEEHGWKTETAIRRWHPAAEAWEDPDLPLPDDEDKERAEHEALLETERQEERERGWPEFEVRVDFPSVREAREIAKKLRAEGVPAVHRWRYLLVGAATEDDAKALAEQIRSEVPADGKIATEGTWKTVVHEMPPNPYAIFGGLGG